MVNGIIIQTNNLEIRKKINESDDEILLEAIAQFKNASVFETKEFIVPFMPDIESGIPFLVPVSGDKKKLLELSMKNAMYLKLERQTNAEKLDPQLKTDRITFESIARLDGVF